MAIALNYRYYMILKHLYSDYETGRQYILKDKFDGNGPQLTWITKKKAAPMKKRNGGSVKKKGGSTSRVRNA